jgi:hypothetical protein
MNAMIEKYFDRPETVFEAQPDIASFNHVFSKDKLAFPKLSSFSVRRYQLVNAPQTGETWATRFLGLPGYLQCN